MTSLLEAYAEALSSGPVANTRRCERRRMVKRLRSGRLGPVTQRDLHLLRQARTIYKNGRRTYDAMHTKVQDHELYDTYRNTRHATEPASIPGD